MISSYPQALLLLSWLSFAFSVVACTLAWRRVDLGPIKRACGDLKLRLDMMEAEQSQLFSAWKRTNARIAMQQARERSRMPTDEDGLPDPQENPEAWRAAVRQKFTVRK